MEKKSKPKATKKLSLVPVETVQPLEPVLVKQSTKMGRRMATAFGNFGKPPAEFTKALAAEIVKNLTSLGKITTAPFSRHELTVDEKVEKDSLGVHPILIDTSILIDGRIVPIVNSGFLAGTLLVPQFVLGEVQHIADSSDIIRRSKGRRGLDAVSKLKAQKTNPGISVKIITSDPTEVKEVDHKLVALAKKWNCRMMTVDFNLAQLARAQSVKVMNVNDLAQALKLSIVPGEEMKVKITHEGKERAQGVAYLSDGTMIVVDDARDKVGMDIGIVITKIHQTAAGQLFFARLQ